jgi:SAM-dependent methyltransferase
VRAEEPVPSLVAAAPEHPETLLCKICGADARFVGSKQGRYRRQPFNLYQCQSCGFAFIGNPWVDYQEIYSQAYYRGQGADPLVDYVFELEHPEATVRQYEWQGIVQAVRSLVPVGPKTRWLDFGCGNGGLVRHCRSNAGCSIWGYEHGWIRDVAAKSGIPFLNDEELESAKNSFDIVTAIEVLEHLQDPLEQLKQIRSLLRPGGLFFFTTGNLAPQREKPLSWSYLVPEIHISFYEPKTLEKALQETGFRAAFHDFTPGFQDIIRFKILKSLQFRRKSAWQALLPWGILTRMADRRFGVTGHPVGWAG